MIYSVLVLEPTAQFISLAINLFFLRCLYYKSYGLQLFLQTKGNDFDFNEKRPLLNVQEEEPTALPLTWENTAAS